MLQSRLSIVILTLLVLRSAPAVADTPGTFTSVGPSVGVDVTINGTNRDDWGYGAAFLDYDGDGDLDLFVVAETDSAARLFEQDGGMFSDVAGPAGCDDTWNGRAVKFADYDNDGDTDIFVSNMRGEPRNPTPGPNRLFRNNGDGTFTNVADATMAAENAPTFGAAWGDYDNDGWLDLYVVNRREVPNQLFHNQGDGTFVEKAAELGLDDGLAGLEAVWVDYDNDGDIDLYLSQDKFGGNRLWRNDGGTFTDVSVESRSDVAINSMGVAVGDYDGNGFVDIYLTNTTELTSIKNVLLRNNGDGTFDNVAAQLGVTVDKYGWGTAFFDYDNDGDEDLYVVNWNATNGSFEARNTLYRNDFGAFTDVSAAAGVADSGPGYGVALGDYDDDGYVDMFVTNNGAASVLYRNAGGTNRWLKVKLRGTESNRDGIGARVRMVSGALDQFRDVMGGSSYLCQHSLEVEFGIGNRTTIELVEVRWPSGTVDVLEDVAPNQTLTIVEGSTTALVVTPFSAAREGEVVTLAWDVTREAGVEGFHVYRLDVDSGVETRLTKGSPLAPDAREWVDNDAGPSRTYAYSVAALEAGSEVRSDAVEVSIPAAPFVLEQNYPNPFNPRTTITFTLPRDGHAKLSIYDGAGRLVRILANDDLPAGRHRRIWTGRTPNGDPAASGVYFYRLETASGTVTRKMMLLK